MPSMLSRIRPQNVIQELAILSILLNVGAWAAYALDQDTGLRAGAVALGLWLAAGYTWLRESTTHLWV